MAQRKAYVGGNWKMHLTLKESHALARQIATAFERQEHVDVVICPPFTYLEDVAEVLHTSRFSPPNSGLKLGAQDFYYQPNGAFTGEVSLAMLKDLGVQVVLAGHSERRHVMGESDEMINRKVRAALEAGMEVILCVGEKLEQRELGQTDFINAAQTLYGLAGVKAQQMEKVTLAYEPVWAIGTGKNATPADAQAAHKAIRRVVEQAFGSQIAQALRIQYGGSVKASNAKELFNQGDIDGGLIGGASLKTAEFLAIIEAAVK